MCQTCVNMVDMDVPPWLWDPGVTWCRRKYYLAQNGRGSGQSCTNSEMAEKKFIDEVLEAHNIYRAKHNCPPVEHAKDLTDAAQRWADHLAKTNGFAHSDCDLNGTRMGENIAMKWTSGPDNYTGQEVTDQWYSEVKMYTFGQEPTSSGTGHFTQVVWKGTKEIGVGKAKTKDNKILVVANYRPAGNMLGQFRDNVLPPKDGKIELPSTDRIPVEHKQGSSPFSSRFENKHTPSNMASRGGESRSVRTFTETSGSGANKVTKTVVEETIIKADGSKTTNRKETITTGDTGKSDMKSIDHHDQKDKDKKGGAFGFFKKDKKGKRSSSSSSDSSPEREKKPQKIKDFIDDAVKSHNELRKKHGVPSLSHDKNLSKYAQKWAEHLAATNSFQHSDCQHEGERLGENIACKWSSGSADYSGKDVTEYWYSEIEKHDFGSEPRSLGSGHFTQVVWKGSKKMGIGKAKSSGGKVLVVASYHPAGNLVGSFVENVPRPKK
ncbi:cell wall protein PRY3-like isoform X2 [Pecten maximus]|uniref:cell wall protein PRY3-like isoform X2 n=1 Tax=Pecten maximus TaxID=6579 RepID=UPI0014580E6D|nr:cell wall protein PRY3-like isoform X2 [Pecten maximus]